MSSTFRALLVAASVITVIWILRQIRKFRVKMEAAIYWIFLACILLFLAIAPEFSVKISNLLGIISPANLIFLVMIFLLTEKVFTMSIVVSQLEEKVSVLSAELALRTHSAEHQLDRLTAGEKENSSASSDDEKRMRDTEAMSAKEQGRAEAAAAVTGAEYSEAQAAKDGLKISDHVKKREGKTEGLGATAVRDGENARENGSAKRKKSQKRDSHESEKTNG
ncbi:MAG: DUF2304 domain-containing protein [Lachnospiraceae bacterium]|nr:DUF2304 domain-containing protein [Lachnospiraceae bacterium]